jgi:hypothetical protein
VNDPNDPNNLNDSNDPNDPNDPNDRYRSSTCYKTPMRTILCALALATVFPFAMSGQQPASCTPSGPIRFVCGQAGPEDLVAVPGTPWLIASGYSAEGGLFLIDTKAASSTRLFPTASSKDQPDAKTYATCPGPPAGADRERFRTHGLFLKAGQGSRHVLYAVHHGARESVEVFDLDVRSTPPVLTWIGCAVAPDPVGLNAVVALPDGGFAATNFDPRQPAGARGGGFTSALTAGENNGEVWEWHPASGWAKVPGSEASGANGIEISKDGKWYYVAQWGSQSFVRLSRGQTPVKRDVIPLGFRVDNVRWAPDGMLLVAGQGGGNAPAGAARGGAAPAVSTSVIGKIDPDKMTYREIINYPTSDVLSASTVAVQVGDEFWVGSFRGDRIARYPAGGIK